MSNQGKINPGYRNRIGYHTALLGGMAFIFSTIVVLGNISTHDDIELRLKEDMLASLQQVLPPALYDNDPLEDTLSLKLGGAEKETIVYRAKMTGKIVGVAFQVTGTGYAGPIKMIMGIDRQGKVLGVRVIAHLETPGLGDKIEVKKSKWITLFDGLSIGNPEKAKWAVKKDGGIFDQFTGATITPRAVIKSIKHGLQMFEKHHHEITDDTDKIIKTSQPHQARSMRRVTS